MMLRTRQGFSLLEVMIALAILIASLSLLVQSQAGAAKMTLEAEKVVTGSNLAEYKLSDVMLEVEREGFQQANVYKEGDFDDFGDEVLNLEFEDLDEYHWEYWVSEIDVNLAGDIAGMAGDLQDNGTLGAMGGNASGAPPMDLGSLGGGAGGSMMSSMMSPEAVSQMLAPYIREVRVRVWWGDNEKEAEERGDEVVVVGHVINPTGVVQLEAGAQLPGGQ